MENASFDVNCNKFLQASWHNRTKHISSILHICSISYVSGTQSLTSHETSRSCIICKSHKCHINFLKRVATLRMELYKRWANCLEIFFLTWQCPEEEKVKPSPFRTSWERSAPSPPLHTIHFSSTCWPPATNRIHALYKPGQIGREQEPAGRKQGTTEKE